MVSVPENCRGVEKCANCRNAKVKCLPPDRVWEDNGEGNHRCDRCTQNGLECGRNGLPPQRSGGDAPAAGEGHSASSIHHVQVVGREVDENLELAHRLEQELKHLDALAKSYRFLWQDIEDIANRQHRFPPRHTYKDFKEEELSLKHLEHIHLGLLAKLEEVALLARTTADGGELRAAVYAFTHLLSTYRSLPFNASHQFRQVLLEVASLYVKKEDWIQAEEHWIEVLQLPDTPENVKEQVLQHLAESLPKSSAELTKMFNLAPPLCEIGNDRMPIPPLLRAMRILHECGMNTVPAELLQIGAHRDVTGSPPIHVAIRSGLLPVCDFIMNCPINQLNGIRESRDSFSRTPFLVAALSRQERPGRSIMARFRNEPLLARQQLINATDGTGQTILSIAISSDCSFQYIEELIEFGAVADPPSLMKCIHTPLQAAAIGGRENVVRVLLEHGARNGSVFGKELTARELAQYAGYNNIAELLRLVP